MQGRACCAGAPFAHAFNEVDARGHSPGHTAFLVASGNGKLLVTSDTVEGIWLVSFIDYDLGYIDLEQRTLQPVEVYTPSGRPYQGLPDLDYPFHDRDVLVTACGRICIHRKKINVSTVLAGQRLGIKEVDATTPLGQGCHLCHRYVLLPMSPGRTTKGLVAGARNHLDLQLRNLLRASL